MGYRFGSICLIGSANGPVWMNWVYRWSDLGRLTSKNGLNPSPTCLLTGLVGQVSTNKFPLLSRPTTRYSIRPPPHPTTSRTIAREELATYYNNIFLSPSHSSSRHHHQLIGKLPQWAPHNAPPNTYQTRKHISERFRSFSWAPHCC